KRLPVERGVAIAAQMLAALDEAHRAAIIHRDIKPSNVMVGENDHVKLVDFGIAKIVEDDPHFRTTTGTFLGTPAYAPPEQIAGQTKDPRSDLYSVAACLYEMCAGQRPFAGKKGGELASAILRDTPPSLVTIASVPEALSQILDRSLAKDPAAR